MLPGFRRGRHRQQFPTIAPNPAAQLPTREWIGPESVRTWGLPRPQQLPPGWTTSAPTPPPTEGVGALQNDPIADVQRALLSSKVIAGRYPGLAVTGMLDGITQAALADFQHSVGIAVTGTIDRATEIALGAIQTIPGMPVPKTPQQRKIQLSRRWMTGITGGGMLLTVLMLIDGWGFVAGTARDIIAIAIAAITPLVVYFVPNWKPPGRNP